MDTLDRMRFICQLVDARFISPSDGIELLNLPPAHFISALRECGLVVETR